MARQTSIKSFFKEVEQKPWAEAEASQLQSGEVVAKLKKYLKFTRDLEGYAEITTQATEQLGAPEISSLREWVNSVAQLDCRPAVQIQVREGIVDALVKSVTNDLEVIKSLLVIDHSLGDAAKEALHRATQEKQKVATQRVEYLKTEANDVKAANTESQRSERFERCIKDGLEVMQYTNWVVQEAGRMRQTIEREYRQSKELAALKYNITVINNDIDRELELTRRLTYYPEEYVEARGLLDADLYALRQSMATIRHHLTTLNTRRGELNSEERHPTLDVESWKTLEKEMALLYKMAKGDTDRAALLKEREEQEDSAEWRRICMSDSVSFLNQQQRAEDEREADRQSAILRAREVEREWQAVRHREQLMAREAEEKKLTHPANVEAVVGRTDDLMGSTN